MENNRKLMLCGTWVSRDVYNPYVLLKGKWLRLYGFHRGDQVTVSNPEPGVLVMRRTMPYWDVNELREKRRLEFVQSLHDKAA